MWKITTRDVFDDWFENQSEAIQEEILAALCVLSEEGPNLGRPLVDTLEGSSCANMKELRVQVSGHPIRACFVFDSTRKAVILCAGDKKGANQKRFYKRLIRTADKEFKKHLQSMEDK
ncbi:type II toxin-antitoxin system RelE/ParE family toxin [Carnimonas bestiolae]|uniref:type II toxin-antitoxin system RelE/ParE family toxin n=1 Tax=Carnimonas bestiolae TaxID=3402172 RepID=UPI003EDBF8A5